MSGCRKRKRRGTSVSRTRSSFSSSSKASSADASEVAAAAAASSGSNGSPATAAPSSTRPRAVREKRELLGQRGRNRGRHVEILGRERGSACRALESERSGELLEIERVAAALLVESGCDGVVDRFAEQLPSLARASEAPTSTRSSVPARCARSSAAATRSGA